MATLDAANCDQSINLNDDDDNFFNAVPEENKPTDNNDDDDDFFANPVKNGPKPATLLPNTATSSTEDFSNQHLLLEKPEYLTIEVSDPKRMGENVLDSHISYKVRTTIQNNETLLKTFRNNTENVVDRRFSDFLGLYQRLKAKHQFKGILVPPPPEKDVKSLAKIKFANSDQEATDLNAIERRRSGLERFLNRIACHENLKDGEEFVNFLSQPTIMSSKDETRTISLAGFKKFIKSAEQEVVKMVKNYAEPDAWFDDKSQSVERTLAQYRQLHAITLELYRTRRELGDNFRVLSQELSGLVTLEQAKDKTGYMSDICGKLGKTYAGISQRVNNQQRVDCFQLTEVVNDHMRTLEAVKELLGVRIRAYQGCQKLEEDIFQKKQNRTRFESEAKFDRLPKLDFEITEGEKNLKKAQENFKILSETVKKQISAYEINRAIKMQGSIKNYLHEIAEYHQQMANIWSVYLPAAV